jgi:predicted MPP superfamily phosphohydrolase
MTPHHPTSFGARLLTPRQKLQFARASFMRKIGGLRFDPTNFEIVPMSVSLPGLEKVFNEFRIVHISDLHLGQWMSPERLEGVVGLVNEQSPDIVAITGDFVSFAVDEVAADLVKSLSQLRPKIVTLAVLGNHDHWMGAEKVRRILRDSNIIDLSNDVYTLHRGKAALHFAGIDDVMAQEHDLDRVLKKLPSSDPAVLLAHEPDFADVAAATGRFVLQLSGHSHGGQFVLPKIGTPFRGSHFKKYPLGRYQVEDMVLYTNRGLGTNTFWIRINCPPEITVLTLQAAY